MEYSDPPVVLRASMLFDKLDQPENAHLLLSTKLAPCSLRRINNALAKLRPISFDISWSIVKLAVGDGKSGWHDSKWFFLRTQMIRWTPNNFKWFLLYAIYTQKLGKDRISTKLHLMTASYWAVINFHNYLSTYQSTCEIPLPTAKGFSFSASYSSLCYAGWSPHVLLDGVLHANLARRNPPCSSSACLARQDPPCLSSACRNTTDTSNFKSKSNCLIKSILYNWYQTDEWG